jgi:hypothetical protein
MTVQARALDLHVRQFRAFHRDGIAAEFAVPGYWEVTTLSAVGGVARADNVEGSSTSPVAQRERRPLDGVSIRSPARVIEVLKAGRDCPW